MMKVKQGDVQKLALLYERYNRSLFSFFYRKTKESQLSEDLVQSVFERILRYRATYSGSGPFTTWMFSIARNAHIDHFRKVKRRKEDELPDEERIAGEVPTGYEELDERNKKKVLLEKALDMLDEDKREVVILSRYEGLKYQEIAEIQGVTESAIKVRMFRAMKDLKVFVTTLSEEYNHE
ncbi:MAG TPA: RNA polymerase sigma factor [Balneolaceae bacterium]|nr:RNA polymerase sigma factor [Balneolaceae bacterium]